MKGKWQISKRLKNPSQLEKFPLEKKLHKSLLLKSLKSLMLIQIKIKKIKEKKVFLEMVL